MKSSSRLHRAAFTLAETLVGASVAAIGIAAVGLLNSAHLRYVQSARQSNAATLALQERVEQMRLADWRKITDPAYLRDTLYAVAPRSSAPLARFTEEVNVVAFPDETAAQKLIVQRLVNGNRVAVLSGTGLATQRLAKVDLKIKWIGSDGRSRLRATTTLISNGGISRMNLPGFGGTTTGTGNGTTTAPTTPALTTPAPTTPAPTTPAPTTPGPTTPAPTTPAPTRPVVTTPVPPGNGNGRGNVGGKPGKN